MTRFNTFVAALISAVTLATSASATPAEVKSLLSNPQKLGETTATLFNLDLYRAELFTPNGSSFSMDRPFALTLEYQYNFSAAMLAMASAREIARMEKIRMAGLRPLQTQLRDCFRDVKAGERITGYGKASDEIAFYKNGQRTCSLKLSNIRARFFNIWLGPKTRDPDGALRLKG